MQDKSYLVYWTRAYILIIGENLNTEVHKHHAYQISYKLDDDMVIRCADHSHSGDVIMFNKNVQHQLISNGLSAMLLIDPESGFATVLNTLLGDEDCLVAKHDQDHIRRKILDIFRSKSEIENVNNLFESIKTIYNFENGVNMSHADERVIQAIKYMESNLSLTPKEVAQMIYLSESRFQHLFKMNTGITFSRYMLWLKTQKTIHEVLNGESITNAAIDAGFSDGSHFFKNGKIYIWHLYSFCI